MQFGEEAQNRNQKAYRYCAPTLNASRKSKHCLGVFKHYQGLKKLAAALLMFLTLIWKKS